MLTLKTLDVLTRYLDSVDRLVSNDFAHMPTAGETTLTDNFCGLLDNHEAPGRLYEFSLSDLKQALDANAGSYDAEISIANIQFTPVYENRVSKGDIGFRYIYEDRYSPHNSFQFCWIAQAKKLFTSNESRTQFSIQSTFSSFNAAQHQAILAINEELGGEYIRYMYYVPRPTSLPVDTANILYEIVQRRLGGHIYDYKFGERLKATLEDMDSSLYAGIFVASPNRHMRTFRNVYDSLLEHCLPFSWDLPMLLGLQGSPFGTRGQYEENPIVCGILDGDSDAVDEVQRIIGTKEIESPAILPERCVTIKVTVGKDHDGDAIFG